MSTHSSALASARDNTQSNATISVSAHLAGSYFGWPITCHTYRACACWSRRKGAMATRTCACSRSLPASVSFSGAPPVGLAFNVCVRVSQSLLVHSKTRFWWSCPRYITLYLTSTPQLRRVLILSNDTKNRRHVQLYARRSNARSASRDRRRQSSTSTASCACSMSSAPTTPLQTRYLVSTTSARCTSFQDLELAPSYPLSSRRGRT